VSTQPRFAGATIAAKSMLASARVVARSFADHHPGAPFFVLLADEADGYFDPAEEPYELLSLGTWASRIQRGSGSAIHSSAFRTPPRLF
jgi:hypothetical protein